MQTFKLFPKDLKILRTFVDVPRKPYRNSVGNGDEK